MHLTAYALQLAGYMAETRSWHRARGSCDTLPMPADAYNARLYVEA